MDGQTTAAIACAVAAGCWVVGGATVLLSGLRATRAASRTPPPGDGSPAGAERSRELADSDGPEARAVLFQGLRSGEPEVRRACVTALGRLGQRQYWAIDGLIEALAERRDTPARVAVQLDRLAPRADTRLLPLLGHPNGVVRYYAARLLAREDEARRLLVPDLTRDPSPQVRAAALEAMQPAPTGGALRRALQLLDDPHPAVRAQACLTASAISAAGSTPFVAPLLSDPSWEVRNAAREALVRAGRGATPVVLPLLEDESDDVRSLAAVVLQDVGLVDDLLASAEDPALLERIFTAGGRRLRALAEDRARERRPLVGSRPAVAEASR